MNLYQTLDALQHYASGPCSQRVYDDDTDIIVNDDGTIIFLLCTDDGLTHYDKPITLKFIL